MDPDEWEHTLIAELHPELREDVRLSPNEMVLVSCFFSKASWYAITTRRLVGAYYGRRAEVVAKDIEEHNFGNFKGYGQMEREVMTIRSLDSPETRFEYETGKPSMAPIYALNTLLPKLKQIQAEQVVADQQATRGESNA